MLRRLLVFLALLAAPLAASAQDASTLLHLLDYVGVDYAGAVEDGKVKSADEYKEMQEFAAQAASRVRALPANPRRAALAAQADALVRLVARKAPPAAVAEASRALRRAVVEAYQLRLAPRAAPPLERAPALYAGHCAACHGATGHGDGPAAKGLDPGPASFHDLERMRQALHAGDLAAIRDVGQNIRCFSRVYGFDDLTALGEEIRRAADACSTLRIVHLQGQLADYLARVELQE